MKKVSIERLSSVIEQQSVYGPPPDENDAKLSGASIGILIILFILGIFALLNKKIPKKLKWIIVSLVIIGITVTIAIIFNKYNCNLFNNN